MQMNANQLTKIPVEKLSDTLQFLIVENEIPLSDALKQVIDDVDAVCKKLLRDEQAPAQPALVEKLKKVMNSWLAMEPKLAFQPEFTDVMMLLDAEPAPAQPVIPEEKSAIHRTKEPEDIAFNNGFAAGWNCCRSEVISLNETTAQPVSEPYKLPSGYALVPCKLTAENGAKSCMIGEFTEQTEISCPECFGDDECETCDGSGMIEVTVPVSWTTIKDIWAKGIEHFAAAPAQESE